jgi:hypothetical protein
MTPKEKAIELVWKYLPILEGWKNEDSNLSKQCAIIAVDEIAKCTKYENQKFNNDRFSEDYWQQVKQEIENI